MPPSPDRPACARSLAVVPPNRRGRRRYRGLTLFGVLMGLTLFSAAVIGAVSLYNTAQETQDRNDAQALLTRLQVAVQQIYLGESAYPAGSLVPALDVRGAIPAPSRLAAGGNVTIRHPFGAAVQVTGAGARFNILFEDLQKRRLRIPARSLRRTGRRHLRSLAGVDQRHRARQPAHLGGGDGGMRQRRRQRHHLHLRIGPLDLAPFPSRRRAARHPTSRTSQKGVKLMLARLRSDRRTTR